MLQILGLFLADTKQYNIGLTVVERETGLFLTLGLSEESILIFNLL